MDENSNTQVKFKGGRVWNVVRQGIHAKPGTGAAKIPVQLRSRLCTIQFSFRDSAPVIGWLSPLGTNALGRGASKLEGWLPSNTGWLERCSPLLPWYGTCIQGIFLGHRQPVSLVTAKLLLPGLRYSRVLACCQVVLQFGRLFGLEGVLLL